VKITGFEVPASVVTVTEVVPAVPAGDGTATRQLDCSGQAMVATWVPNWTLIWPEELTKLLPVITTICPGVPVDGSTAVSTGAPSDGGVVVVVVAAVVVVVETATGLGELAGAGIVDEAVAGGVVGGELDLVAARLRATDAEVDCEFGLPLPLIDDQLTRATIAATRATETMKIGRVSRRFASLGAVDPAARVGAGASAITYVGGGADGSLASVREGRRSISAWRDRRAASAMAASARALASSAEW
jgi:hypothetical protein